MLQTRKTAKCPNHDLKLEKANGKTWGGGLVMHININETLQSHRATLGFKYTD